jgi:hypothetical protein
MIMLVLVSLVDMVIAMFAHDVFPVSPWIVRRPCSPTDRSASISLNHRLVPYAMGVVIEWAPMRYCHIALFHAIDTTGVQPRELSSFHL